MKRFPDPVRNAMKAGGAAATCLPVRLDDADWSAALFIELAGPECKDDRRALKKGGKPVPVGMESDLIETEHGAVVMLRAEVHTGSTVHADADGKPAPFVCEVLMLPGEGGSHFEALKLLGAQPRLAWFFGDAQHWLLHSQSHPLGAAEHEAFTELLSDATRHDAVVRMTGRYDAQAALGEVARHYELRASAPKGAPWQPAGSKDAH